MSPDFSKLLSNFGNISSSKVFNNPSQENNVKENGQNSVNKNEQRSTKNAVKDTGNNRYNSYSNEQDKHSIFPSVLIILIHIFCIFIMIGGKIQNNNDQIFVSKVLASVSRDLSAFSVSVWMLAMIGSAINTALSEYSLATDLLISSKSEYVHFPSAKIEIMESVTFCFVSSVSSFFNV